jgi:YjbE family integral membrane protein
LTAVATHLLTLPYLKAIGGVLLLGIAFKLLKEEEESAEGVKVAETLRGAIATILVADFVISLENILAVAAAAHGIIGLLLFGLMFSMAILMLGGALTANLIVRFWWLAYMGAGVIAWVGAELVLGDPLIADTLHLPHFVEMLIAAVVMIATLALAHYVHRHRPGRQRAAERMLTASPTEHK